MHYWMAAMLDFYGAAIWVLCYCPLAVAWSLFGMVLPPNAQTNVVPPSGQTQSGSLVAKPKWLPLVAKYKVAHPSD